MNEINYLVNSNVRLSAKFNVIILLSFVNTLLLLILFMKVILKN